MFVLILAAGAFLLFIAVLACLLVAHTLEEQEQVRKRNIWTRSPLKLLCITQAFEPVYAPLWEAPIEALQLLRRRPLPARRLYPVFFRTSMRFPEIYDGCEFMQWLEFLECEDLVSIDPEGNKVTITRKGREFLANRFVTESLLEA